MSNTGIMLCFQHSFCTTRFRLCRFIALTKTAVNDYGIFGSTSFRQFNIDCNVMKTKQGYFRHVFHATSDIYCLVSFPCDIYGHAVCWAKYFQKEIKDLSDVFFVKHHFKSVELCGFGHTSAIGKDDSVGYLEWTTWSVLNRLHRNMRVWSRSSVVALCIRFPAWFSNLHDLSFVVGMLDIFAQNVVQM